MSEGRLLAWFRINLALLTAAVAMIGSAGTFLVRTTQEVSTLEATMAAHDGALRSLQTQMDATARSAADADKRMVLIEARLGWALDHVSPAGSSSRR